LDCSLRGGAEIPWGKLGKFSSLIFRAVRKRGTLRRGFQDTGVSVVIADKKYEPE
jgi:hypothetical protein